MYDLTTSKHFQLHFQPSYYVHYQEYNNSWRKDSWEIISQCKSIKRIQYNTQKYKKYIIIDIDNETENLTDLPNPNFIVKNKFKTGKHLFYVLDRTISNEYYSKIWKEVQTKFTILLGGDTKNVGYIGKNLYNNIDFDLEILETQEYNINYLYSFIKDFTENEKNLKDFTETKTNVLKIQNTFSKNEKVKTTTRNNDLFNELRFFAYSQIKKSVNDRDFIFIVKTEAHKINEKFYNPLKSNEVESTSKSVINYCLKNKSKIKEKNRGIMNLEDDKPLKLKQKLGALYTAELKNIRTEQKIRGSIVEMKFKCLKINISTLSEYTKLSRPTLIKYKELIEEILLND